MIAGLYYNSGEKGYCYEASSASFFRHDLYTCVSEQTPGTGFHAESAPRYFDFEPPLI